MARGKVITTYLRTGDPNGIRTVFISNKICEIKALALIEYGRKEKRVKRLELIRVIDNKQIWRLDFKNSNVIEDMKAVDSDLKLANLFKEYNER